MQLSIKRFSRFALYLVLALTTTISFFGFTNAGLNTLVFIAQKALGVDIKMTANRGYLLGNFTLTGLSYQDENAKIGIGEIIASYSPWSIIKGNPTLHMLSIKKANIKYQNTTENKEPEKPLDFSSLRIPHFTIKQLQVIASQLTLNGTTYHLPHLKLEVFNNKKSLTLKSLDALIEGTHIKGFGSLSYQHSMPLVLTITSTGHVNQQTQIKGDSSHYMLTTSMSSPYRASLSGHLANLNQFSLKLSVADALIKALNQTTIKDSLFMLDGNMSAYRYSLSANLKNADSPWLKALVNGRGNLKSIKVDALSLNDGRGKISGRAQVTLQPMLNWEAKLNASNFNLADFNPTLNGVLNATIKSKGSKSRAQILTKSTVNASGRLFNQALSFKGQVNLPGSSKLNARLGQNTMTLSGNLAQRAKIKVTIPDTSKVYPSFKTLKSRLSMHGTIGQQALLTATLSRGSLTIDGQHKLAFTGANARLRYGGNQANIASNITINASNTLALSLSTRIDNANKTRSTINGSIRANFNDLSMLDKLITDIDKTKGRLSANIRLFGQLSEPGFSINARLSDGQTFVKPLNLLFSPITLSINSSHRNWSLQGRFVTNGKPLILRGSGLTDFDASHYRLSVSGSDVTIIDNKEFHIKASPALSIQSKARHLFVKGKVTIPEARLSPTDFSSSEEISDDIIIVKGGKKVQKTQKLGLNLGIHLGDKVNLDLFGLKGQVKGNLKIYGKPGEPLAAKGRIKIVDGKFDAYGQHLKITQGELSYHDGPVNNPLIDLTAVRVFRASGGSQGLNLNNQSGGSVTALDNVNRLVVGIRANGRAKKPKITLFSNPGGLSQADILSMIVLGRPAHQADNTEGGGELLAGALSALNLGGGSSGQQLTDEVQHAVGFSVSMETQTNYTQDGGISNSPALVLSKSISSKIQLQYSAGFGEGANIIRILYNFKPNWSLITETSGNATGFDVLYNYQRQ